MADEDLTGPRECEKSGEFKAGGVFFRDFISLMRASFYFTMDLFYGHSNNRSYKQAARK